jgi:excisionase family DNA binding protein
MASNATPDQSPLLTMEEASRYLRLSRQKTYQLAQTGELPTVRMGRSVRVRRDRLQAWLDERSSR